MGLIPSKFRWGDVNIGLNTNLSFLGFLLVGIWHPLFLGNLPHACPAFRRDALHKVEPTPPELRIESLPSTGRIAPPT